MALKTKRTDEKFKDIMHGSSDAFHQVGVTTHVKQYGSTAGVLLFSDSGIQSGQIYVPASDFPALAQLFDSLTEEFGESQETLKAEAKRAQPESRKPTSGDGMV